MTDVDLSRLAARLLEGLLEVLDDTDQRWEIARRTANRFRATSESNLPVSKHTF